MRKPLPLIDQIEREYIYVTVYFDNRRFMTSRVKPDKFLQFNEIMLFDFDLHHMIDPNGDIKFDDKLLKKMN